MSKIYQGQLTKKATYQPATQKRASSKGEKATSQPEVVLKCQLTKTANQTLKQPGTISHCLRFWKLVTSNRKIRSIVKYRYRLQFKSCLPKTPCRGRNPGSASDKKATEVIDKETEAILSKGAARVMAHSDLMP